MCVLGGGGLNNEVTSGQRPEGSEREGSHVGIWGNHIPGGEGSTCKGPEVARGTSRLPVPLD